MNRQTDRQETQGEAEANDHSLVYAHKCHKHQNSSFVSYSSCLCPPPPFNLLTSLKGSSCCCCYFSSSVSFPPGCCRDPLSPGSFMHPLSAAAQ